jgi:hypothetical protein
MLRLMTLITARYNWRTGELTVGRREIARLWGVDERTVKREMARLRDGGFLILRRPGVRGRVAAYAVDFDAVRAAADPARVGPDFAARLAPVQSAAEVIPFPQTEEADTPETASPWTRARRQLSGIGAAPYQRWIAPLRWAGSQGGRARLEAPSAYHAAFVDRTYGDALLAALQIECDGITALRVVAAG